jgi:hypothetical protein
MSDLEKLSSFYLGRVFDQAAGQTTATKVLYDANDLTTHAVCVGMTGSGKTGLCLSMIEEAALDGIPIIAIDPKGDLGNLLLAFPELRPADFEPWVDPDVARQKEISIGQLATETADTWKKGLAQWDQNGERIAKFNAAVEKTIYTPGSTAGIPLTVLKGFHAPPPAVIDDTDTYNDLVQSTTQGVLALVGIDADPVKSREAILIANILSHSWRAGKDLDLAQLIREIQRPPFDKVGIVDMDNFISAKDRLELGMKINNLLASPSFASWLEGESLEVQKLLYTDEGKPRLSILSIAHLNDAERMFFVTILLNEVLSWMRSQPGTSSLRAILYMDEVFGYFPPSANPPSKRPMLTLLKQARAYGLGVVLATQNPVDLDYKGLSNAGTWFLGRLQTERDKLRVLEGLEGVSAEGGTRFNRQEMDAILSDLKSRVFLVNNVHSPGPIVMQTRWAMSYLRGPLTREQIRVLMKDRKEGVAPESLQKTVQSATTRHEAAQPMLSSNIVQKFWPLDGEPEKDCHIEYRPALLGEGKLHFIQAGAIIDIWRSCTVLKPIHGPIADPVWDAALVFEQIRALVGSPTANGRFANLPPELAQEKSYRSWERDLKEWLYQSERYVQWQHRPTDTRSKQDETEDEFRVRIAPAARKAEQERIEREFDADIKKTAEAIAKAEAQAAKYKWWWFGSVWRVIEIVLVRLLGGKSRKQLVTATSTDQMNRGRRSYSEAQEDLDQLQSKLTELQDERSKQLAALETNFLPATIALDKIEISPRKSDIDIRSVILVWLPWQVDVNGQAQPLY